MTVFTVGSVWALPMPGCQEAGGTWQEVARRAGSKKEALCSQEAAADQRLPGQLQWVARRQRGS